MSSSQARPSTSGILLPMQEASPDQLGRSGPAATSSGLSSRGASLQSTAVTTTATAEFQLSLVQQQLQQSLREVKKLKEEVYETSSRLTATTTKLNEQKVEYSSLSNRYSSTVEKLTSVEGDTRKLEEHLVQEKTRVQAMREDRDRAKLELREAIWEVERLQKLVAEAENNRGLDQRQVQRMLSDRSQYIPASEVQRMEADAKDAQKAVVNRLTAALDTLLATTEESETSLFVVRSAVLSAATELETRVLRAEAALDAVHAQLQQYSDGLEQESSDFLLALMAENKELWQHLTKLQSEHDLVEAELTLQTRRGELVPRDEHEHAVRQVELLTDRLGKVQKIVAAQTQLAREHEAEMQALMEENDRLRAELAQLEETHEATADASGKKSAALESADKALREAAEKIEQLEEASVRERRQRDEAVQQLQATHQDMQQEYEHRLRDVQEERATSEEARRQVEAALDTTTEALREAQAREESTAAEFARFRAAAEDTIHTLQQQQSTDLNGVREMLEQEMTALRAELEQANAEARAAVRQRDTMQSESQSLSIEKKALEKDLEAARREREAGKRELDDALQHCRALEEAAERQRNASGEEDAQTHALRQQVTRLSQEKDDLDARLVADQERSNQRYQQLHEDWQQSETARTSLQDEVKELRLRLADLEAGRHAGERSGQEQKKLMQENLRLHEQYQKIQAENTALVEDRKALRAQLHDSEHVSVQIEDLQRRLRELPQLRLAADDARREALKAKEETSQLRQERDAMAARLDKFLEESKAAARMDDDFNRIFRDASDSVKRLGGQLSERQQQQQQQPPLAMNKSGLLPSSSRANGGDQYRVFSNTSPQAHVPYGNTPGRTSTGNSPREGPRPTTAVQPTGQRPWKA